MTLSLLALGIITLALIIVDPTPPRRPVSALRRRQLDTIIDRDAIDGDGR